MANIILCDTESFDLDKYNNAEMLIIKLLKKIEENTRK
jgi:hypothetical protein